MPIQILMPALSPTMEKGNLAKWHVKVGDKVTSGKVIAEIETDKATMEVEAVDEGVVANIVVPEGSQDVPVNQLIAILAAEGEDLKAAATATASSAKPQSVSTPAPIAPASAAPAPAAAPALPSSVSAGSAASHNGAKFFASPLAKRLAKEKGIDLSRVTGSGPHGRIIAKDLEGAPKGSSVAQSASAAGFAGGMSDAQIKALYAPGSYEEKPHDGMRRIVAQRLTQSKQTVPHFYLTSDCELDALMRVREEMNKAAGIVDGKPVYKLSVNDFIIKAMAVALQQVPTANATWTENARLLHKHSDVGVAVSVPDGLFTPVIRKAELKRLSEISNEMKDLAHRARNKKLKPEEYQGGTTAVSNLGMFGVREFAAVINPPHGTILAVGAGEQRAVVKNGSVVPATVMSVTLSVDHRAVDGALGAELLAAFKQLIEQPLRMLV